jgi:hypothetical protein
MSSTEGEKVKKKEIYTHEAEWLIYGMNWSVRQQESCKFRLALGSFQEEYTNKVEVRFDGSEQTPSQNKSLKRSLFLR